MLGLPHQPVGGCHCPHCRHRAYQSQDALPCALRDEVNQLGRDTGQAQRLRTVTPHRLFLAVVSALASAHVESLAVLLRAFNYQTASRLRIRRSTMPSIASVATVEARDVASARRAIERANADAGRPGGRRSFQGYCDPGRLVVCAQTDAARDVPGRFTTIEPAAVEVHATYSGFSDEVSAVQIAPDRTRNASSTRSAILRSVAAGGPPVSERALL